jgi:hypothetical protein
MDPASFSEISKESQIFIWEKSGLQTLGCAVCGGGTVRHNAVPGPIGSRMTAQ